MLGRLLPGVLLSLPAALVADVAELLRTWTDKKDPIIGVSLAPTHASARCVCRACSRSCGTVPGGEDAVLSTDILPEALLSPCSNLDQGYR